MRDIVAQYPRGIYHNTLAVGEFRLRNFERAIKAALVSVKLTPGETQTSGPYPGDLAVLAMANQELGNTEQVEKYRAQFAEAMKSEAFKNDDECRSFQAEVKAMFASSKNQ